MKNKIILLAIFSLFLFGLIQNVNALVGDATTSITTPSNNAVLTTSARNDITLSITSAGLGGNVTNVTWFYRADTTSAWIPFSQNATNEAGDTTNATTYTNAFDTTGLTDGTTYQINATSWNSTLAGADVVDSQSVSGLTVDNTAPTAVLSLDRLDVDYRDLLGATADCSASSDAIDTSLTYLITLTKPDGTTSTSTDDRHTFKDTDFDQPLAQYTINCQVTDSSSNSATTDSQTILVRGSDGELPDITIPTTTLFSNKRLALLIVLGASTVVAIVGVVWFFNMKKSKKKRRK